MTSWDGLRPASHPIYAGYTSSFKNWDFAWLVTARAKAADVCLPGPAVASSLHKINVTHQQMLGVIHNLHSQPLSILGRLYPTSPL